MDQNLKSKTNENYCDLKALYLDIMKKSLVNWIYGDFDMTSVLPQTPAEQIAFDEMASHGYKVMKPTPINYEARTIGYDPRVGIFPNAKTMIGSKRLDNIQYCIEEVLKNKIPGDLIETGVWRGGATILMRAVLKANNINDKIVWVADSFEGCPKPNLKKYPKDGPSDYYTNPILIVSLDDVKNNFQKYGLLDDKVKFLKGWFKDTLPKAPIEKLALIRLDGDLYESTMDALINLYPKLSKGGYIIIDDYLSIPACFSAVEDYRDEKNITDEIIKIDLDGVYWKKTTE